MYIFKLKKLNNGKFETNKESWFEDYVKKNFNKKVEKLINRKIKNYRKNLLIRKTGTVKKFQKIFSENINFRK